MSCMAKPVQGHQYVNMPRATVTSVVRNGTIGDILTAAARSGWPKMHSDRDERKIIRVAHMLPRGACPTLQKDSSVVFSRPTYQAHIASLWNTQLHS